MTGFPFGELLEELKGEVVSRAHTSALALLALTSNANLVAYKVPSSPSHSCSLSLISTQAYRRRTLSLLEWAIEMCNPSFLVGLLKEFGEPAGIDHRKWLASAITAGDEQIVRCIFKLKIFDKIFNTYVSAYSSLVRAFRCPSNRVTISTVHLVQAFLHLSEQDSNHLIAHGSHWLSSAGKWDLFYRFKAEYYDWNILRSEHRGDCLSSLSQKVVEEGVRVFRFELHPTLEIKANKGGYLPGYVPER